MAALGSLGVRKTLRRGVKQALVAGVLPQITQPTTRSAPRSVERQFFEDTLERVRGAPRLEEFIRPRRRRRGPGRVEDISSLPTRPPRRGPGRPPRVEAPIGFSAPTRVDALRIDERLKRRRKRLERGFGIGSLNTGG
jgi:hypothetical protein